MFLHLDHQQSASHDRGNKNLQVELNYKIWKQLHHSTRVIWFRYRSDLRLLTSNRNNDDSDSRSLPPPPVNLCQQIPDWINKFHKIPF